jgi:hypothetical protein
MIALAANNMITNNNKAFYKFPLFSKWNDFHFYNSQLSTGKKENHEFTLIRRGNESQSKNNAKDALNDINVHIILILHSKELSIFIVDFWEECVF